MMSYLTDYVSSFFTNSQKEKDKQEESKQEESKQEDIKDDNIWVNTFEYTSIPQHFNQLLFKNKKNIGLCFSGGGPRSFAATLGYIRALHQMDILKEVKYISCVSGSTWAWIPYTYLPKDHDERIFIGLDKFGDLDTKLDIKMMKYTDDKYLGNSLISHANNLSLMEYIYEGLRHMGYGERTRIWPYMLGKIFLEPYNMLDTKFFAPSQEIVDIYRQPPLNITEEFKLPYNKDRPFIISNTSLVKPGKAGTLINTDFDLLVMTPLYCGTLATMNDKEGSFGGNYSNTYSFHPLNYESHYCPEQISTAKANVPRMHTVADINRLNLFDMMGSSSTAYGIVTELIGLTDVNPSYRLVDTKTNKVKYFDCIDGGILDNVGILPMLQNGVKNIVLFVNSNNRINVDADDQTMTKSIEISLRQLFLGDVDVDKEKYLHYFEYVNDLKVFENLNNLRWKEFLDKMRDSINQNDIAYIEMNDLHVLQNKNFNVEEYILDKLLIVYLYQSDDWTNNRLESEVQEYLKSEKDFPYYATIFENRGWIEKEVIQLTAPQVNLLGDLCYWNVMKNSMIYDGIRSLFT